MVLVFFNQGKGDPKMENGNNGDIKTEVMNLVKNFNKYEKEIETLNQKILIQENRLTLIESRLTDFFEILSNMRNSLEKIIRDQDSLYKIVKENTEMNNKNSIILNQHIRDEEKQITRNNEFIVGTINKNMWLTLILMFLIVYAPFLSSFFQHVTG